MPRVFGPHKVDCRKLAGARSCTCYPRGYRRPTPIGDRFWQYVDRKAGDGCWVWTGDHHRMGYGRIWERTPEGRQRIRRAHHVSFEMMVGPIPPGMNVLHRCDNPPCVRPDHLFLGTHLDNMRDMVAKGRRRGGMRRGHRLPGARNARRKLTAKQVVAIRHRAASGERILDLAREHGFTYTGLKAVVDRKTWRYVA